MFSTWFKQNYNYQACHWLYGRCLGFITLIAFFSYWYQADALIGDDGLSPWTNDLANIEQWTDQNPYLNKWKLRPTLLWLAPLASHHLLFVIGCISALLLTIGILPTICGLVSYLCTYPSWWWGNPFLVSSGISYFVRLLLSLPFLPLTKFHKIGNILRDLGLPGIWSSPYWQNWCLSLELLNLPHSDQIMKIPGEILRLDYHYWTQPLPHGFSAWITLFRPGLINSLYLMYVIELILPFFLLLPGFSKNWSDWSDSSQFAILLSGNYGFFNLLTLCLCLPLIDDEMLPRFITKHWKTDNNVTETPVLKVI